MATEAEDFILIKKQKLINYILYRYLVLIKVNESVLKPSTCVIF